MTKQNNSIPTYLKEHCFADADQDIYLGSSLKLFRNLEQYKFPSKLSSTERKQVLEFTGKTLLSYKGFKNPKMFHGESMTPFEKEFLYEYFQGMDSFHQAHIGDGFIFDTSGELLCILNVKEHLCLQAISSEGNMEASWIKLAKIEEFLDQILKFSFSNKYGYLTANFMRCGCALKAYAFVQVPALVHTSYLEKLLTKINREKINVAGMHMSEEGNLGDVVVLSNRVTLGVSEEQVISSLHAVTTSLILEEQKKRGKLDYEEVSTLKDKVYRAFGLLTCSFQLDIAETLEAISLLKLGLSMEWLEKINLKELNHLFNTSRRAHLFYNQGLKEKDIDQISHHRSEFMQKSLKKVKINI